MTSTLVFLIECGCFVGTMLSGDCVDFNDDDDDDDDGDDDDDDDDDELYTYIYDM